jgi:predicted nucleic acid-binding Zn finger protein
LIDADICLINKRQFDQEKHKNDQYLLYVACSRAIKNMVIFSKFDKNENNPQFKLNPWFSVIPKQFYILDNKYNIQFKYPKITNVNYGESEKIVTKILDRLTEEKLNKLYNMCKYSQNDGTKQITQIYDNDFSKTLNSSILLGKYVENLFIIRYMLNRGFPKKRFPDIENIIDSRHMITNVHYFVNEWYYANRDHFTWEKFENEKHLIDANVVSTIEAKFDKSHDFDKHTIVTDGYFKHYVIMSRDMIKANYTKYLNTKNMKMLRTYLFHIIVLKYALETQHYFHIKMRGQKFKSILTDCSELFDHIEDFAVSTNLNFTNFNVPIENSVNKGEIDALEDVNGKKYIWEFKCTSEISLKHILQVMMYNIMYNKLDCLTDGEIYDLTANFINFLKGEIVNVKIQLDRNKVNDILQLIL